MRTNFVLIDFESVQPESLRDLEHDHFKIIVFVGANQAKLPTDVAMALQRLGDRARYIQISGNGPNALDFHIAFYIGQMATEDPTAYFHIISKDKGFDPLIKHLKLRNIYSARSSSIADIPLVKATDKKSPQERAEMVIAKLRQPKATQPRKVMTLSSHIATLFQKQLSDEEIAAVVAAMQKAGFISISEGKVTYTSTE